MQKLYFESAWDKTIAPKDRKKIESIFAEQTFHLGDDIHFLFLWEATNHKSERLITVLIHNGKEAPLPIRDTIITYLERDEKIATGIFNMPCDIAGKTTMPWTFIFSSANQTLKPAQYKIQNRISVSE